MNNGGTLFHDPGLVVVTPKKDSLKRFIYVQDNNRISASEVHKDVLKFKHSGTFVKRFTAVD